MDRIDNTSTDTVRYSEIVGVENNVAIRSSVGSHSCTGFAQTRINIAPSDF
jgi:hypothetical protein